MKDFRFKEKRGIEIKKPQYKILPLFHIYDSELSGTQKLLMFLVYINKTWSTYDLSVLARMRTEDVILDLKELKKRGYIQS